MNGLFDLVGFGGAGTQGGNLSNFLDWGGATGSNIASNLIGNLAGTATGGGSGGILGGVLGNMGDFLNSDAFKLMAALGMTGWGMGQEQNNYKKQMDLMKYAINTDQKRYEQTRKDNMALADRENKRFTSVVQQDPNTGEYYVTKATDTPDINWA